MFKILAGNDIVLHMNAMPVFLGFTLVGTASTALFASAKTSRSKWDL
jgi:hypothetical protein